MTTVTLREKNIILSRMPEQHTPCQSMAKFALIQTIIQEQTVGVEPEIEPKPTRGRAEQVISSTHQRLIDLAIDSVQDDEHIGMPDLVSDDEDQESIDGNLILKCKMMALSNISTTLTL